MFVCACVGASVSARRHRRVMKPEPGKHAGTKTRASCTRAPAGHTRPRAHTHTYLHSFIHLYIQTYRQTDTERCSKSALASAVIVVPCSLSAALATSHSGHSLRHTRSSSFPRRADPSFVAAIFKRVKSCLSLSATVPVHHARTHARMHAFTHAHAHTHTTPVTTTTFQQLSRTPGVAQFVHQRPALARI